MNKNWLKNSTVFVEILEYSTEVKYLGITLDEKLIWHAQVDKAIESKNPKMARWLYIYNINTRAIITYISMIMMEETAAS